MRPRYMARPAQAPPGAWEVVNRLTGDVVGPWVDSPIFVGKPKPRAMSWALVQNERLEEQRARALVGLVSVHGMVEQSLADGALAGLDGLAVNILQQELAALKSAVSDVLTAFAEVFQAEGGTDGNS